MRTRHVLGVLTAVLILMIPVAVPALAGQAPEESGIVVGYVTSLDGDTLVLSNVPTVAAGRVFQLGAGQMFIAEPEEGGEVVVEGGETNAEGMRIIVRGAGEGEATTETATEATAESPRIVVLGEQDPKADPETDPEATAAESGAEGEVLAAATNAGGVWVMESDEGGELPGTDIPLELHEIQVAADAIGRELLIPGLQVRLHVTGEGDARIVTEVEIVEPEGQQEQR